MDKNSIKKYAVWARRELISRVSQRALLYGISEKDCGDSTADTVNGHLLTASEKRQRQSLIAKIKKDGYQQAIEAAAYTWFNRFSALRFMEVNGYLPSHVRVFTDEDNNFKPQILAEAIHLDIDGLDMEKVYEMKDLSRTDELYKYLLITQCNALGAVLPGMFTRIEDYTELLFPDNLLREGSVIEQMIARIPQEDWTDQVQIIGWLYQYYNAEPKDKVFADLKKNIKISKENIPAATQLFTPDWIVRYMVENSLGRIAVSSQLLAVSGQPLAVNFHERELERIEKEKQIAESLGWKYYLPEAEQEEPVRAELTANSYQLTAEKLSELRVIDPCMGSGHILVYMFDVLIQIYEAYGYNTREAAALILQNNLYGLDIDDRASQLAYFAVMMKARQYDRRIFTRGIQPHVYAIVESNSIDTAPLHDMGIQLTEDEYDTAVKQTLRLLNELRDAKEYGSILTVTPCDWNLLRRFAVPRTEDEGGQQIFGLHGEQVAAPLLQQLINIGEALSQKYHAVVTNPPYMGSSGMIVKLSDYVKKNYPDSKSDLFAVFIERCGEMCESNGYQAMITQHAWMFLSSFEKLREKLMQRETVNMAHLGARAFEEIGGEVVQTTSFVMQQNHINGYKGMYCRLIEPTTQQGKEDMFLEAENRYTAQQDNFAKIPGSPVAYWLNRKWFVLFEIYPIMRDIATLKKGTSTGDNNLFIKSWHEVSITNIFFDAHTPEEAKVSHRKWFPINGGGERRKWYGNRFDIVNWEDDGTEMKALATKLNHGGHWSRYIINPDRFFTEGIGWSAISSSRISARYIGYGFAFSSAAMQAFDNNLKFLLGLINSKVADDILKLLAPTLNFGVEQIGKIPVKLEYEQSIEQKVDSCILLSKKDWDSFETSWDFKRHPLV